MKLLSVVPSHKAEKKLDAKFETESGRTKVVSFGQKNADDYTKTKDKDQRARYLDRHSANENWSKLDSPGALSRWILWGESTSLLKNIASYKNRVN